MNWLRIMVCACLVIYGSCLDEGSGDNADASITPSSTDDESRSFETSTESSLSTTDLVPTTEPVSPTDDEDRTTETSTGMSDVTKNETTLEDSTTVDVTTNVDDSSDKIFTANFTDASNLTTTNTDTTTTVIPETTEPEVIVTGCSSNPCKNGGTCLDDSSTLSLFSCVCPTGYEGLRCGTINNCEEDKDGQRCKKGSCVTSEDGLERFCACFRRMYWDDDDKECKDAKPPCFPNPCQNGGSCSSNDGVSYSCKCLNGSVGTNCSIQDRCGNCTRGNCTLDDKGLTKHCECNPGLYFDEEHQQCEDESLPCFPNPCQNGGSCVKVNETEYNCTCLHGFSGSSCKVTDLCSTDEDCKDGVCILSEDESSRTCQCNEGFYLKKIPHTCEVIDQPCKPNPCSNDGICNVLSKTDYKCTCSNGYKGTTCGERDLCVADGGDGFCGNATCNDDMDQQVYFCTCPEGQYFDYLLRKCKDLDLCPLLQCDQTEYCREGKCKCKDHYKWSNDTGKCEPNFCSSNPCPLIDMLCEEGTGPTDYSCSCKNGYAFNGTHCNEAVCIFPSMNACGQHCVATSDGYTCTCAEDFELNEDNHTCVYTRNTTCYNKTCEEGVCVMKNGEQTCICKTGYVEVDGNCVDICSAKQMVKDICPNNECETISEGGFKCKCEGKYVLSEDGTTCVVRDICDMSEVGGKNCSDRNAECIPKFDEADGFLCRCAIGQIKDSGGICRDLCSLNVNQRVCSLKRATCDVDAKGEKVCKCPPYFRANSADGVCDQPARVSYVVTLPLDKSSYQLRDAKMRAMDDITFDFQSISNDMTLAASKMFHGFDQANVLTCRTAPEYILCRIEVQFSIVPGLEDRLERLKINQLYQSVNDSKKCLLPPSLILARDRISKDVDIKMTDPCDKDIKETLCGSETTCTSSVNVPSFNCSCKDGFSVRKKDYPFDNAKSFIELCTDIDECVEGDPCPVNSKCTNTIGSYSCSCNPGFRSVQDSSDVKSEKCLGICNPSPCTNGACSSTGDHTFECTCDAGYRGSLCNLQDHNFKRARNNSIIVGVVLGGILLIAIILSAVYISRLKRKKYFNDPGHMVYNSTEMSERNRVQGRVNNAFQRE